MIRRIDYWSAGIIPVSLLSYGEKTTYKPIERDRVKFPDLKTLENTAYGIASTDGKGNPKLSVTAFARHRGLFIAVIEFA